MSSKRAATRAKILSAARELIETGHYNVGLGEIGRRAGVSRQAVYLHFASRAELLTALTSWIEEEADLRGMLATVNSAPSGVDALARLLDASALFEPQIQQMVQATMRMQDDPTVAELSSERMRYRFAGMRQVVARIESDGRLVPGWDVDTATAFVWTLTAPSSFDLLVHEHGWSPRQWADSTYRLLCDAFVQPAPDPHPHGHPAT